MSKRIGFWSVLALVIGSQIGSGVFMLPASLASYGIYSVFGWIASSIGAMSLAIVFAHLCRLFPKTGGPHVYVERLFGKDIAFFTGWTYWIVSWVSTTAVIIAAIGYLSPFIGEQEPYVYLFLEILLLLVICIINLFGVNTAGRAEAFFTLLKFIPLFIVPIIAIWGFDINNFQISDQISSQNNSSIIAQATLLTLWGFIGLESATTPAGSIENPEKTIPKALVIGTFIVAAIYVFNSVAIMGIIPGHILAKSNAPYVTATEYIFDGSWHLWVSIAASIICIGTLNAWVLTSSQISLGLAQDKMMPKIFAKLNKYNAPYSSVIFSCLGILPLLILTSNKNMAGQISALIDVSVISFLFVYVLCVFVSMFMLLRNKAGIFSFANNIIAMVFCFWVIIGTPLNTIMISSLFTLSGIPVYFLWYKKQDLQNQGKNDS